MVLLLANYLFRFGQEAIQLIFSWQVHLYSGT
jgi:hypothetical protein